MRGAQAAVLVLDPVQVLDEKVAAQRTGTYQGAHLGQRLRVDDAALGLAALAPQALCVDHLFADFRQRGLLAFTAAPGMRPSTRAARAVPRGRIDAAPLFLKYRM